MAKTIKACLDRNPDAFKPKIGKGMGVGNQFDIIAKDVIANDPDVLKITVNGMRQK